MQGAIEEGTVAPRSVAVIPADGGHRVPPHKQRRGAWLGEGRGIWASLFLLPVLAWAVLVAMAFSHMPPPLSTGDALFDKYLQAVATALPMAGGSMGHSLDLLSGNPAALDDEVFARWEPEFGNDPRFWMLRHYATTQVPAQHRSKYANLGVQPEVYYLEEARRRGAADGPVLSRLLLSYDSAWPSEAVDGAEHEKLLNDLLTAAPGEALPYYYAAMYEAERGNYEAALDHLKAGNRAPHNSKLIGFPFDRLWQDMREGRPLPDKFLSGMLCSWAAWLSLTNFIKTKQFVRQLAEDAVAREDLAMLDELHTFACRFGNAEGNTILDGLVGLVMAETVENTATSKWPQLHSSEQNKALGELNVKHGKLVNQFIAINSQSSWIWRQSSPLQAFLLSAVDILSGGHSTAIFYAEEVHDDALREQTVLGGVIDQMFRELESFDYTKLDWE
ncbi:hypothetical protein IIA79_06620 [bacterium]|nr:hypothetical protein [bacterium]